MRGQALAKKRVVAIGDVHAPWHSKAYCDQVVAFIEARKPQVVVQVGDLYDLFSWGRFPRTLNIYTPAQELDEARRVGEELWARIRRAAPRAKCFQLWGNHDDRAVKNVISKSPEHEVFVSKGMKELMTFPGVTLTDSSRDELVIDGVVYIHGYLAYLGAHARFNQKNTVCGHTHYGGVLPINLDGRIIWELNVGFVGDRFAKPLSYTAQRRFSRWTPGVGEVDEWGPRFVPFQERRRR